MQITTFNPMILTGKSDEVIKLFEELGFERRHEVENVDDKGITSVRMKDANGFCVDVAQIPTEKDIATMRMNVRDFDEAYEFLKARGFTNPQGDHIVESASARSCLLFSPSGFSIQLTQHIRKEDREKGAD
ncbi:MAG: hypothetical protein E7425_03100 [Ruminococcaceae bacterium]|jgi:hypothetical protein|nr:hypothetical protein [Oscillospiraceae bacterium]